jgi:nucleolysin TIA-1/TIAR
MRSAETALQTLNGRKIFDMEIRCNWAYQNQTPKEDLTNHYHVFVGDLSPEVNDEVLQKAFQAFGSLSDARCMWDMNSGKSRGYGFLAFRDKTDAEQAIATMNGEWLGSRAIRVNWANQKNGVRVSCRLRRCVKGLGVDSLLLLSLPIHSISPFPLTP